MAGWNHFRSAAMASWMTFVVVIFINGMLRTLGFPILADLVGLTLLLAGFVLGVTALFGITRYGRRGILMPAITGLLLNALFLFIWATNFGSPNGCVAAIHGRVGGVGFRNSRA